jgi:hypothetical protein
VILLSRCLIDYVMRDIFLSCNYGVTLSFVFSIVLQVYRNPYDFGFVRNWKIFLGIDNRKRFVSNRNAFVLALFELLCTCSNFEV